MKVKSPYKTKEIMFQRNYPGYLYRRELVDDSEHGGNGDLEMVNCYESENGQWLGDAKTARMLCKKYGLRNIQKIEDTHCVCSIGFNESEQKWYGWSHRAIYGFGIGSTCKIGDCGYVPETPKKLFDNVTKKDSDGWQWLKPENVELIENGVRVKTDMVKLSDINDSCLTSVPCEPDYWEIECGRGEWTAKTIEDAKQMAIDFSEGVS